MLSSTCASLQHLGFFSASSVGNSRVGMLGHMQSRRLLGMVVVVVGVVVELVHPKVLVGRLVLGVLEVLVVLVVLVVLLVLGFLVVLLVQLVLLVVPVVLVVLLALVVLLVLVVLVVLLVLVLLMVLVLLVDLVVVVVVVVQLEHSRRVDRPVHRTMDNLQRKLSATSSHVGVEARQDMPRKQRRVQPI